jgi:thiol-disulfide isomerase/thioredoxin
MLSGTQEVLVDIENGVVVYRRLHEQFQQENDLQYEVDTSYQVRKMTYSSSTDAHLFTLPAGMHEVKTLSTWTISTFRSRLIGKPAPELHLRDIRGNALAIESFRGKIVLLDFWATWCPPCRADAPALEILYGRYSDRDLMIVGVSVNESRKVVEKYLSQHGQSYPTALSIENEMPRPYQAAVVPTYVVIDRDGTVTAAVDGDQGLRELRKLLRKAGLEVD